MKKISKNCVFFHEFVSEIVLMQRLEPSATHVVVNVRVLLGSSYIRRLDSRVVAMTTMTRGRACHLRSADQPTGSRHEITLGLPPTWLTVGLL